MVNYYNDYEKAKNYTYRLLTFRPRTRYEIMVKLQQKKVETEIINQILTMLEELKLIDDRAFAVNYVQQKNEHKPMGRKGLIFQLRKSGISDHLIQEILADFTDEQEYNLALNVTNKFMSKHNFNDRQQTKIKLISLLKRRGFCFDIIDKIVKENII